MVGSNPRHPAASPHRALEALRQLRVLKAASNQPPLGCNSEVTHSSPLHLGEEEQRYLQPWGVFRTTPADTSQRRQSSPRGGRHYSHLRHRSQRPATRWLPAEAFETPWAELRPRQDRQRTCQSHSCSRSPSIGTAWRRAGAVGHFLSWAPRTATSDGPESTTETSYGATALRSSKGGTSTTASVITGCRAVIASLLAPCTSLAPSSASVRADASACRLPEGKVVLSCGQARCLSTGSALGRGERQRMVRSRPGFTKIEVAADNDQVARSSNRSARSPDGNPQLCGSIANPERQRMVGQGQVSQRSSLPRTTIKWPGEHPQCSRTSVLAEGIWSL